MVWCALLELMFMFLPYPVVSHLCRVGTKRSLFTIPIINQSREVS